MSSDNLEQFLEYRRALQEERQELVGRIAEIDEALGGADIAPSTGKRRGRPAGSGTAKPKKRARRGRAKAKATAKRAGRKKVARKKAARKKAVNKLTLKEAVAKVTASKALSKPDILAAVQKFGYKFRGNNPMNSLNTVLYTGKQFKNAGGKFSAS